MRSRDARFDGEFFFAVETTGIYCRPSCPAVTPKRHNVRFYPTAAARDGDSPLSTLTAALADGTLRLDPGADRDETHRALLALPGLDPRTVAVVRARALGDPDVAPPGVDVPDTWRPWRSYALHHLIAAGEWESSSS